MMARRFPGAPLHRQPPRSPTRTALVAGSLRLRSAAAPQSGGGSSAGNWCIFQQNTYAPDANHRWMGSVNMDRDGNIALGYGVSSSTLFPEIRYAGRLATDPLNTLAQDEATLFAGTGSQTHPQPWGDYSSLSIDPTDDCTFWYT